MNRIKDVTTSADLRIMALFQNGVRKSYDIKQLYSKFPQFKIFEKNKSLFNQISVDTGGYGVSWNDELDLSCEEIWDNGQDVGYQNMDIYDNLAANLTSIRESCGYTQKQLSEITGIQQAEINKIERGISNPSIKTLKRLADGMHVNLSIAFNR